MLNLFRHRSMASQPFQPPAKPVKSPDKRDSIPDEFKERRALVRAIPVPEVSEGNSEQDWSEFDACCDGKESIGQ